jgi:hypothetical protein
VWSTTLSFASRALSSRFLKENAVKQALIESNPASRAQERAPRACTRPARRHATARRTSASGPPWRTPRALGPTHADQGAGAAPARLRSQIGPLVSHSASPTSSLVVSTAGLVEFR